MQSNVNKAMNIQILSYIDNIYTHARKAMYVIYGNLSCLEVITNLKNNYHKITPAALKENAACMTSAYGVNQTFETFID